MSRSALHFFAIGLAALPLALGACSREPLYGPELPVEQTATIENFSASDGIGITGSLGAKVIFIDGRQRADRGPYVLLPGVHTFRVQWNYDGCGAPTGGPRSPGEILLLPAVLLIYGTLCGVTAAWPHYGRGTRDIVAALEAGKVYEFEVDGVDGTAVYLWFQEEETGKVVGGESPTEKAPYIAVPKPPEEPIRLAGILWNGKWFAKAGAWSLYLEAEDGTFTGRALRKGRDPYSVAGTISEDSLVTGRIEDDGGAPIGALNGTFPNISLLQDGRVQASFGLEKRE